METEEGEWGGWNWRTEGDMMVNGAFFVPSGEGMEAIYEKASSIDPKSAALVDQLTMGAGVLGGPRYVRAALVPFFILPRSCAGCGGANIGRGRGLKYLLTRSSYISPTRSFRSSI